MHSQEGRGQDVPANMDQKKVGMTVLLSDKVHFGTKGVTRDREGHYAMLKG